MRLPAFYSGMNKNIDYFVKDTRCTVHKLNSMCATKIHHFLKIKQSVPKMEDK